jgi:two-component system, OmpR family, sensor histidine kinase KdpD
MSTLEQDFPFAPDTAWSRSLLDSILAFFGSLLITAGIFLFHLYPRIPDISLLYLPFILALSLRSRYASLFASFVSVLAFDYFLIPPIYTFVVDDPGQWIALCIFLFAALLTSQLTSVLRLRAAEATRHERETHILYDLLQTTNQEEQPERQLQIITQAIVHIFSSWGIHDCAILQADADGKLQIQNSAYQSIDTLTLSEEEGTGAAWVLAHGRTLRLYEKTAHHLKHLSTGSTRQFVQLMPLQIGQKRVGLVRLRVLQPSKANLPEEVLVDGHGSFFGNFLAQAASLMEQARLRQENLQLELMQRTDSLRAALLSSVSHDLRTPLTSIKAASTLLQEEVNWDPETRRSFAVSIEHEADRMNRLVKNLLDMSRIEEGVLKPEKDEYLLEELIEDVLERMALFLKEHPVHTTFADALPPVSLDAVLIDQVLTNLLENAVHYTPPGSPIDIVVEQSSNGFLVRIADSGPGIPEHELERIFDKFYRVLGSAQKSTTSKGSGLGLAVCRGIMEAHHGNIWAEQRSDGGTVFCLTFPLEERLS